MKLLDVQDDKARTITHVLAGRVQKDFIQSKQIRLPQETIWLKALRNFNGEYGPEANLDPKKSQVFVRFTRTKVMGAVARLAQILFPSTGEMPWTLEGTPNPLIHKIHPNVKTVPGVDGQPRDVGELISEEKDETDKAAEGMRREIKCDLLDCSFPTKELRGLVDYSLFGSMVFKGPMATPGGAPRWSNESGAWKLGKRAEDVRKAAVEHVSPFDCYPDPAANKTEDLQWFIQRRVMNRNQVASLCDIPSFDAEEVKVALKNAPHGDWIAEPWESSIESATQQNGALMRGERFVVLEWWGRIRSQELRLAGLNLAEKDDDVERLANIWVLGNHVIKMKWAEFQPERIPYFIVPYEIIPHKLWGRGPAEMMEDSQAILNAGARTMMNNMGIASGPQVVVDDSKLVHPESANELFPWKVWLVKDMEGSTQSPVQFIHPPSIISEIKLVMDIFRSFMQEETSMPDLVTGNVTGATHNRTAAGMGMLFGAADTQTKMVLYNLDHYLTIPMITAWYHWKMQYSTDDSIKGDMVIKALGVQGIMAKEVLADKLIQILQFLGNPALGPRIKMDKLISKILYGLDLEDDDLAYTHEEFQKMQDDEAKRQAMVQSTPQTKIEPSMKEMAADAIKHIPAESVLFAPAMKWFFQTLGVQANDIDSALDIINKNQLNMNRNVATPEDANALAGGTGQGPGSPDQLGPMGVPGAPVAMAPGGQQGPTGVSLPGANPVAPGQN